MAQDGFIPPAYQVCDYLQAQGDRAVIDTGVPGDNDNLKFAFRFWVDRQISYRGLFTNYSSENANCWRVSENVNTGTSFLFTCNTKTGASRSFDTGSYVEKIVDITLDKEQCTITKNGIT